MTVKKVQLKNTSTNDIIYPESSSQIIYRNDEKTTVEASLSALETSNNNIKQQVAQIQTQMPIWEQW